MQSAGSDAQTERCGFGTQVWGVGRRGTQPLPRRDPTTDGEGSAPSAPPSSARGAPSARGSAGDSGGGTRRTPAPRSRPSPLSTTARGAACARGPAPAPPAGPGRGGPASPRPPSPRPSPALTISALPAAWPRPCRLHAAGRAGGHRALTSGPRASVARQRRAGGDVTAGTPAPNPDPSRPSAPCLEWGRAAAPRWVPMALLSVPTCPSHRLSPTVLAASRCVPTQCSTSGPCSPHSVSPSHGPRGPLWSHVGSPWSPMASHWVPMGITQCRPHKVPMSPLLVPMAESGRDPIGSLHFSLVVPVVPHRSSRSLRLHVGSPWPLMPSHWVPVVPTQCPQHRAPVVPHSPSLSLRPHVGSPWPHIGCPTSLQWGPVVSAQCPQMSLAQSLHGPPWCSRPHAGSPWFPRPHIGSLQSSLSVPSTGSPWSPMVPC